MLNNPVSWLNIKNCPEELTRTWWEPCVICPSWEIQSLGSQIPDTASDNCGGLPENVFRLTLMAVYLHCVTQLMKIRAFVDSIMLRDFFLGLTFRTSRSATSGILSPYLVTSLKITLGTQMSVTQIASLFPFYPVGMVMFGLIRFMWLSKSGGVWPKLHLPH